MRTLAILCYGFFLVAPFVANAAPNGAKLYKQHCAACHGTQGKGGVGVPLALPDFQGGVSDEFLERSIRFGRPGRIMPAFSKLDDAQVKAIVKHLRQWTSAKPPEWSPQRIKGNRAKGKLIYKQYCAACHGENGEGGTGTGVTFSRARDLPIIAPALNNGGFLLSASDQMIKKTLMQGRRGTPMKSFLKQGLTEEDINDTVAYVRSFSNNPLPIQTQLRDVEKTTLMYESPYDLQTTVENIKKAAIGKNFRIIRTQALNHGLVPKEKESKKQVIIYFCNFQLLNSALKIDPRVGLFLPCRVTAVEHEGKVMVLTINPKRLSRLFNNYELNKLCSSMYDIYLSIIEEAIL